MAALPAGRLSGLSLQATKFLETQSYLHHHSGTLFQVCTDLPVFCDALHSQCCVVFSFLQVTSVSAMLLHVSTFLSLL